jgi:energy-coupling factor transporter ATP-binding protein EcfA2
VRALAIDPQIMLMDEPFAALDAQTREVLQEELLRIMQDERKTMVFITHSIDEAILLGDRIAVMSARPGRIKEDARRAARPPARRQCVARRPALRRIARAHLERACARQRPRRRDVGPAGRARRSPARNADRARKPRPRASACGAWQTLAIRRRPPVAVVAGAVAVRRRGDRSGAVHDAERGSH